MLPFTTAGSTQWQVVSWQAYGIAALVSGMGLLLVRPRLRSARATAAAGAITLVVYAVIAAVSVMAAIMLLPELRSPDRPLLLGSAQSVFLYAVASTGAGGVAAWTLSWRARLRQTLRESRLRARQAQQALLDQRDVDARLRVAGARVITEQIQAPLRCLLDSLDQRTGPALREAAGEVRRIAEQEVRPASHALHSVDPLDASEGNEETIGSGIAWWRLAPLRQSLPVVGIWLLSVPGAVLIPATGPGPIWAGIPDLVVLAVGLVLLRMVLRSLRWVRRLLQWALLTAGLAIVGAGAGIAFAIALGEAWSSLIATGAIVHVISGVALSLGRGWGAAMTDEIAQAQQATLQARTSLAREVAAIDQTRRFAADILHSRVQTRLLAIADLLGFAAAGNTGDLPRAVEELRDTCESTLPEVLQVLTDGNRPQATFDETIHELLPDVAVHGARNVDQLVDTHEVLYGVVLEACSNAVRHGGASVVDIRVDDDSSMLRVRDNGAGVPAEVEPGLGLSATAVHFPGWTMERVDGWTELRLPMNSNNHHRAAEATSAR
jgi:signal transduction histidine kinase